MNYTKPSFSVNPSGAKAPKDCKHGWVTPTSGRCVLCGEKVAVSKSALPKRERRKIDPLFGMEYEDIPHGRIYYLPMPGVPCE